MQFLKIAEERGWPRIVSIQNPYNLLNRSFEIGLAEMAIREDVGLLAYSPLGFGTLSGKYLGGAQPEGARLTAHGANFPRYLNAQAVAATEEYVALARAHGLDPAQMALAYVNSRPFLTANIIGASKPEQLADDIASIDIELPEEVLKGIEQIHTGQPNPSP
jgi:aryl-alcohol dehydrogenase-like predicted oxidoreductase